MAGIVLVAFTLTTLVAGQNGQGASARDSSNGPATPQLQIGAHTYVGDRPVATAVSGASDVANGTVWIDPSGCGVGSASGASASVRETPGPSAVRWTYAGHIVDRAADTVVADIEWERHSVVYGDLPRSTKRVNLRVGDSVVIDELALKAPENRCGASVLRFEASLVVPMVRGFRGGGAGFGGGGTTASGSGSGVGSDSSAVGGSAVVGARGTTNNGAAVAGAARGGSGSLAGAARVLGRADSLPGDIRQLADASYDAEVWLVHTPEAGQEETQRAEGHLNGDGQAFDFPGMTISSSRGPAKVEVAAFLRPATNDKGDIILAVAIVRAIYGPGGTTGRSVKIIPMPSPSEIISFELPDTHGTTFDVLSGHRFSVRVRIAKK